MSEVKTLLCETCGFIHEKLPSCPIKSREEEISKLKEIKELALWSNLILENKELKQQIEKMKCSANCQIDNEGSCAYEYMVNNCPCDRWEMIKEIGK